MGLIPCPECKKSISESAASCPKCGYVLTPEKIVQIKNKQKQIQKKAGIGCLGLIGIIILIGVFGSNETKKSNSNTNAANVVSHMTALEQMEIAFDSGYTKQEIKPPLDKALKLYGVPITEENYGRAGSVLVALRKEFGPKEMDILDYMIRSYVPGTTSKFHDAAAIACSILATQRIR